MHQVLNNKLINSILVFFICISLVACNKEDVYIVKDFLNNLALSSGISQIDNINSNFELLKRWNIVDENDRDILEDELKYKNVYDYAGRFIDENDNYKTLVMKGIVKDNAKENEYVSIEDGDKIISALVYYINNREFDSHYIVDEKENIIRVDNYNLIDGYFYIDKDLEINDYVFIDNEYKKVISKENNKYELSDVDIDEVINMMDISGSEEFNFEDAEVIENLAYSFQTEYVNNKYSLLASKRHHIEIDGFDIYYTLSTNGIDFRITKDVNGVNVFNDISISNFKPSYKWKYENGNIIDAYFKVNYKVTNEFGVSTGRYKKLYLDFRHVDSSSFKNAVNSIVKESKDEVLATIPLCEVKLPLPNCPLATLCMEIMIRLYVNGKVELVINDNPTYGFEIKNGNFRLIKDTSKDLDGVAQATARTAICINFSLQAVKKRLMDIEADAGIRLMLKTTVHLYDEDNEEENIETDYSYSTISQLIDETDEVKICGDISFNWVLTLYLNTSRTLLYKYGLYKSFNILDADNQVFNNLTHIENGKFVKTCTAKGKQNSGSSINEEKISLEKYSAVINVGELIEIPLKSLPSGYQTTDLVVTSSNNDNVSIIEGKVKAIKEGNAIITIKTSDGKYSASFFVLVNNEYNTQG